MRILAIGDPHGSIEKIKQIPIKNFDLILVTGDLGKADMMRKMAFENVERRNKGLSEKEFTPKQKKKAFMEAYTSSMGVIKYLSKFAPVYTIFGNVESNNKETKKLEKEYGLPLPYLTRDLNEIPNVKVLNNKLVHFRGIKIGGLEYFIDTNWVQEFKPKNYREKLKNAKKDTEEAKRVLKKFGLVDILVHHQPPYGVLDKVTFKGAPKNWIGKHAGSKTILNYIKTKKPKYTICGHIHEGEGTRKIGNTVVYNLGVAGYEVIEL